MTEERRNNLPTHGQLCVLAKEAFATDIDSFEWSERIKNLLVQRRFDMPMPQRLTDAMDAVDRAQAKFGRTRPVTPPGASSTSTASAPPPLDRSEATAVLTSLLDGRCLSALKSRSVASPEHQFNRTRQQIAEWRRTAGDEAVSVSEPDHRTPEQRYRDECEESRRRAHYEAFMRGEHD